MRSRFCSSASSRSIFCRLSSSTAIFSFFQFSFFLRVAWRVLGQWLTRSSDSFFSCWRRASLLVI